MRPSPSAERRTFLHGRRARAPGLLEHQVRGQPCDFSPDTGSLARKDRNRFFCDLVFRVKLSGRAKTVNPLHVKRKSAVRASMSISAVVCFALWTRQPRKWIRRLAAAGKSNGSGGLTVASELGALVAIEVASGLQVLAQLLAGTMEADFDRIEGEPEDGGDLAVGEPFELAQNHDGLVIPRKAGDEFAYAGIHLFANCRCLRRWVLHGGREVVLVEFIFCVGERLNCLLAQLVQRHVGRDAVDPGRNARIAAKAERP